MIGAIYEHGRFTPFATEQTALALSFYAIGLAGYAAIKVLSPAFYALGDARTPMVISLASVAVNYVTALTMVRYLHIGHVGLALSTSVVAIFGFAAQLFLIRGRLGGIEGRYLATSIAKIAVASALMAAAVWLSSSQIEHWLGTRTLARLVNVGVSISLGATVFGAFTKLLHVQEVDQVWTILARRLRLS